MRERKSGDADNGSASAYRRPARHVEVRRSAGRWRRYLLVTGGVSLLASTTLGAAAYTVHTYLTTSPRFALRERLTITPTKHVARETIAHVFASDAGRSVFDIPLDRRREELLALPWIASASLMRGWPNRLRVVVDERVPVAFVRLPPFEGRSARLGLIDAAGALLPLPRNAKFQFPVLTGISDTQSGEERRKRVAVMLAMIEDLDREMPRRSGEISEIDLSDPEDAAVTVPAAGDAVLVHLGNRDFLDRYKYFLENIESWRGQYGSARSVDLRYEKQAIVKP